MNLKPYNFTKQKRAFQLSFLFRIKKETLKNQDFCMTNVLTAFSCQRTFVIFYLLNSDITGGVVHNYAFSCIYRHIGCR